MKTYLFIEDYGDSVFTRKGKDLKTVIKNIFKKRGSLFCWDKDDFDKEDDIAEEFLSCDWNHHGESNIIIDITNNKKPIRIYPKSSNEDIMDMMERGWK